VGTLVAARFNPVIRAFYQRLRAAGKAKKVLGRLYAETADNAQRDAQASDALADGAASARLTIKTVADPECDPEWF